MLSKEDIIKANDTDVITVDVPEWGDSVFMAPMKGFERDAFEMGCADGGMENFRAKLVGLCLVDSDGTRLFNNNEIDDLGKKNARVLNRLFDQARNLCGMSDDDVEELAGNSESVTNEGSGSSSP